MKSGRMDRALKTTKGHGNTGSFEMIRSYPPMFTIRSIFHEILDANADNKSVCDDSASSGEALEVIVRAKGLELHICEKGC